MCTHSHYLGRRLQDSGSSGRATPPKATPNRFVSNIKIRTFNESAVDLQSNKNCNDRRSTAVFALMFLYYYRLSVE